MRIRLLNLVESVETSSNCPHQTVFSNNYTRAIQSAQFYVKNFLSGCGKKQQPEIVLSDNFLLNPSSVCVGYEQITNSTANSCPEHTQFYNSRTFRRARRTLLRRMGVENEFSVNDFGNLLYACHDKVLPNFLHFFLLNFYSQNKLIQVHLANRQFIHV